MLREPDFIIAGATLGGTRALLNILDAHPQISLPRAGEPRYFQPGKPIKRIFRPLYEIFEDAATIRINNQIPKRRILCGEEEFDPLRAVKGAPSAKIIFSLRNPVLRSFMQFHNAKSVGKETARTFEQAIEAELVGVRTPDNSKNCWIYKNQYQKHLEQWLSIYPKHQILILICEEWSVGLHKGLSPLESFLGLQANALSLEHSFGDKGKDSNVFYEKILPKIIDYPPLSEKLQAQLEDIFITDINYVENLLGRKILSWS